MFKKYEFRVKADYKIELLQDVFKNETVISLIPQYIYELEDVVKNMPEPYCEKGQT
jgi:hypothetical protein